jgi:myo-inositol-1(or 4)-monophosphatase
VNDVANELFTAEKGHGAYLNDKRLRVASRKELAPALFATGLPFLGRPGHARALAEAGAVMAATSGIRRFGAAALDLAWTAAGRIDGFWEHGINLWDTAAGIVLVREAGGVVSDCQGRTDGLEGDDIVCANEHLHPQLLKLLKGAKAD